MVHVGVFYEGLIFVYIFSGAYFTNTFFKFYFKPPNEKGIIIIPPLQPSVPQDTFNEIRIGICAPSSCSSDQMSELLIRTINDPLWY